MIPFYTYPEFTPNFHVRKEAAQSLERLDRSLTDRQRVEVAMLTKRPELAAKAGSAGIESLIDALSNPDWCKTAVIALGMIGDARAVDPLIVTLKNPNKYIREQAMIALGRIGDARGVEPLIVALKDRESRVREEAAKALERLDRSLNDWQRVEVAMITNRPGLAVNLGLAAIKPLTKALANPDWSETAVVALIMIGGAQAVDPLITALKNPNSNVREQAAIALGMIGDTQSVEPLVAALKDPDRHVQQQAAVALVQLNPNLDESQWVQVAILAERPELAVNLGSAATEPLLAALVNQNKDVREQAVIALGRIGDVRAVDPLIAALKDSCSNVREQVAFALGEIGDIRAVDPLIAALKDSRSNVCEQAALALGRIGDVQAVDPLVAALKDSCSNVREQVAFALGVMGDVRAIDALIAAINDPIDIVRIQAATSLGKIGDVRAVDPLITALKDTNDIVRIQAAKALESLDQELDDWQRVEVAMITKRPELAAQIGSVGIEPLSVALDDSEWSETAIIALRKIGGTEASDLLIAILEDSNSSARAQAAQALGEMKEARAVDPLIAVLKTSHYTVQAQAAFALGEIGDVRAVHPLIAALRHWHSMVREQAAVALGKIGDVRAVEPLVAALKDQDSDVRGKAVQALSCLDCHFDDWQRVEILMITNRPELAVNLGFAAIKPLNDALANPDYCETAVVALIMIGGAQVVEPLIAALKSPNRYVQERSAIALGDIGDARAVKPLIAFTNYADKDLQGKGRQAISKIGVKILPPKWPTFSTELYGNVILRVNNPNNFHVRVGIRAGHSGKDFMVPPFQVGETSVAPGSYSVYFQYSYDPLETLKGNDIHPTYQTSYLQIDIVRSYGGNYNIRRV